jgi:hypothetical protein
MKNDDVTQTSFDVDVQAINEMETVDTPDCGRVTVSFSPYDVPERLLIIADPTIPKLKIAIEYITSDEVDRLIIDCDPVQLCYGKHSGRIYGIFVYLDYAMDALAMVSLVESALEQLTTVIGPADPGWLRRPGERRANLKLRWTPMLGAVRMGAGAIDMALAAALSKAMRRQKWHRWSMSNVTEYARRQKTSSIECFRNEAIGTSSSCDRRCDLPTLSVG